ncbi:MAG: hypothetical protein OXT49_01505 [Gammaproteobacteria bacterium]|nr:hypothetical protein [Gammaproteobacteria bacterium]
MITVEIDPKSNEAVIHADPIELREFAKKLWAISEKAEAQGKHIERLSTKAGSEIPLSPTPRGDSKKYRAIKQLTLSSSTS